MLPQYMALSVLFVSLVCQKNLSVRSLGYIVGASPPLYENMCVHSLGYIVGASPLVCVLSLEENLCWILACCLLRFATFFTYSNVKKELSHVSVLYFPFYK